MKYKISKFLILVQVYRHHHFIKIVGAGADTGLNLTGAITENGHQAP